LFAVVIFFLIDGLKFGGQRERERERGVEIYGEANGDGSKSKKASKQVL
jgi:hypothetical protein